MTRLFLIVLSVFSHSALAQQGQCKNEIVFLPQTHAVITPKEKTRERTARAFKSQFKVAKYLEANPGIPVFTEARGTKLSTLGNVSREGQRTIETHQKIFGRKLPAKIDQLNEEQAQTLLESQADLTVLAMGIIDTLYTWAPSLDIFNNIMGRIKAHYEQFPGRGIDRSTEIYRIAYDLRESMTLTQVNKFFAQNPNQRQVILLFGTDHDFFRHANIFPPQCIVIPEEFQGDYIGAKSLHPEVNPLYTDPRCCLR